MYKRIDYKTITDRMNEPRKFIQVIMGPRQIGKTTVVKQVLKDWEKPYLFFSADNVPATQTNWISDCWQSARAKMKTQNLSEIIIVIDEIQKINDWSSVVKKEWDYDTFNDLNIKAVMLGSSRVMLEKGLSESMMGRFEEIRMSHWSFPEMQEAFGTSLEQYIYFGGYPGAAHLVENQERWEQYINSSIIDATINKDILLDTPIGKPALMRQTFELGAAYSGNILSLTKMLGSLKDAGNTVTLSNYINLLNDSGLLTGLQKFSIDLSRRRASIPKFQVYNNALRNVYSDCGYPDILTRPEKWGHVFESAVGAHILNYAFKERYEVNYWREGNFEVDFVLRKKNAVAAIEVKSNNRTTNSGLQEFVKKFKPKSSLVVGNGGLPAEDFFRINPADLLK
ncbi:MAG: ATP-binding protein [Bacteroidales bacterium]|nr:ATP-binding protein [Bacteroidales bacterium]